MRGEQALNEALLLLSRALDLCVRAKKLDAAIEEATAAGDGSGDGGTRCLTPALWVQDRYDRDLEEWMAQTAGALQRLAPHVNHLPTPSGTTALLDAALSGSRTPQAGR